MQGIFDFEFIGDFFYQRFAQFNITIFRQVSTPQDFVPVHIDSARQSRLRA